MSTLDDTHALVVRFCSHKNMEYPMTRNILENVLTRMLNVGMINNDEMRNFEEKAEEYVKQFGGS